MLSFVIATYHNPPRYSDRKYLRECITSIVESATEAAALERTEIIVVDGGSPEELHPGEWGISARSNAVYIDSRVDLGVCHAFRLGAHAATMPYIVPLNADDSVARGFVPAMHHAFAEYAHAHAGWMPALVLLGDTPLTSQIEEHNYLPYCAAFRADFWHTTNGYEDVLKLGGACPLADWDLWIRVWQYYKHATEPPIAYARASGLLQYRQRADSASRWTSDEFERMRAELWRARGITPQEDRES